MAITDNSVTYIECLSKPAGDFPGQFSALNKDCNFTVPMQKWLNLLLFQIVIIHFPIYEVIYGIHYVYDIQLENNKMRVKMYICDLGQWINTTVLD